MANYILVDGTLYHHGIKGQRWGIRRFQNEDGSYTPEGRERYGYKEVKKQYKDKVKQINADFRNRNANILSEKERNKYEEIRAKSEFWRTPKEQSLYKEYGRRLREEPVRNYMKRREDIKSAKKRI